MAHCLPEEAGFECCRASDEMVRLQARSLTQFPPSDDNEPS